MAQGTGRACSRCGFPLDPRFRFCPGCALSTAGGEVLSTQISAKRHEAERSRGLRTGWHRALVAGGIVTMVSFVVGLGVLVNDRDLTERLLGAGRDEAGPPPVRRVWGPTWAEIPAGTYTIGPPGDAAETETVDSPFFISATEVPNRLWDQFLGARASLLREKGIWDEAVPRSESGWTKGPDGVPHPLPDDLDRPIRDVAPLAGALFCEYLTETLAEPGWEIRFPTRAEWEIAARGAAGLEYPWGREFYTPPPARTGSTEPRPPRNVGSSIPVPVSAVEDDVSPFRVMGMGTNVAEMVVSSAPWGTERFSYLVENRIVEVSRRGASYANTVREAEEFARTWERFPRVFEPRARFVFVGLRLVKARRRLS